MNAPTGGAVLPVWRTLGQSLRVFARAFSDGHFLGIAATTAVFPPVLYLAARLAEYSAGLAGPGSGSIAHLFALLGLLYAAACGFRAWASGLLGAKTALRWYDGIVPRRGTASAVVLFLLIGITASTMSTFVAVVIADPEGGMVVGVLVALPASLLTLVVAGICARWCLAPTEASLGSGFRRAWAQTRGKTWRLVWLLWLTMLLWQAFMVVVGLVFASLGPPLSRPLAPPPPIGTSTDAFWLAAQVARLSLLILPGAFLIATVLAIASRGIADSTEVAAVFD